MAAALRDADGTVLGTLDVGGYAGGALLTEVDRLRLRRIAALTGRALDRSRPSTAPRPATVPDGRQVTTFVPGDGTDLGVGAQARAWVRRVLPGLARLSPRPGFYEDMDLLVSEVVGNAVRHGGGLRDVRLSSVGAAVRVSVADHDPRSPILRDPFGSLEEGGRGMPLIAAFASRWGVERHVDAPGKSVWFELAPDAATPASILLAGTDVPPSGTPPS